jgi:ABC-type dipeptide/oligopeptide/nickel transport system permease subunit
MIMVMMMMMMISVAILAQAILAQTLHLRSNPWAVAAMAAGAQC